MYRGVSPRERFERMRLARLLVPFQELLLGLVALPLNVCDSGVLLCEDEI